MIVTTHEQFSDEELLRECEKQWGNPLVAELKKRLESAIDSQKSYEVEIETLKGDKISAVKAQELSLELIAEQAASITALQAEVASLKEALDLLA